MNKKSSFFLILGPLLFLTGIFFINFLARTIFAPLMPPIEEDLNVGHKEAGYLFLLTSGGYCVMLILSGFISSRLNHRRTITLSLVALGLILLGIGFSSTLWEIRSGLFILGMAAGLYLPSGIATITGIITPDHWGKAIAVHELAPNLFYVLGPIISEILLLWFSWRQILILIGISSFITGLLFASKKIGKDSYGEAPNSKIIRSLLKEPAFWLMVLFFSYGIGSSFGVYSMVPLYLVSERGMDRTLANTILGLSRISGLFAILFSGWITDHLGARRTLKAVFLISGIITAMLGLIPGSWVIIVIVFIQPIIASAFFPAGFAALSNVSSPVIKKVGVSFTVPFGFFLGGGAIPAGLGFVGEIGSFSLGFIILGGLIFTGTILVRFLR